MFNIYECFIACDHLTSCYMLTSTYNTNLSCKQLHNNFKIRLFTANI